MPGIPKMYSQWCKLIPRRTLNYVKYPQGVLPAMSCIPMVHFQRGQVSLRCTPNDVRYLQGLLPMMISIPKAYFQWHQVTPRCHKVVKEFLVITSWMPTTKRKILRLVRWHQSRKPFTQGCHFNALVARITMELCLSYCVRRPLIIKRSILWQVFILILLGV